MADLRCKPSLSLEMIDRVMVEGYSKIVMQALKINDVGLASYGFMVTNACDLENKFSELSYSHTKREDNKLAYSLAKLAANFPNCIVWKEDVLSTVLPFVQADLTPFH